MEEALERDADNDAARIFLAKARLETGDTRGAWEELSPLLGRVESGTAPQYKYYAEKAAFELVHTFPAHQRGLLFEVAAAAARALGRSGDATRYERLAR